MREIQYRSPEYWDAFQQLMDCTILPQNIILVIFSYIELNVFYKIKMTRDVESSHIFNITGTAYVK